ncbi:SMI1/KNR4 family protein [Corynebacterium lubricantis]|uniref:SMI1/KNR4 family protein n=1 Tax=Corynebacterium lubricantis TaxID=541095 RepID=UPI00037F13FB|nr:SMI1/KNR4 family protein [Corynebacterium lubricantis]
MHIEQQHLNPLLQTFQTALAGAPEVVSATIHLDLTKNSLGFDSKFFEHLDDAVDALYAAIEPTSKISIDLSLDRNGSWMLSTTQANPSYIHLRNLQISDVPSTLPQPTQERIDEFSALWEEQAHLYTPAVPATREELAQLETSVGQPVPPEMVAFLHLSNGARHSSFDQDRGTTTLIWDILDTQQVADRHQELVAVALNPSFTSVGYTRGIEGATQLRQDHAGWIPFAHDFGGNYLGIDTAPGPRGTAGQVFLFGRDEFEGPLVIADSLVDFFTGRSSQATEQREKLFARHTAGRFNPADIPDGTQELILSNHTGIDLNALSGHHIKSLTLRNTAELDLEGIAQLPLQELDLANVPTLDLEPLAGHPTLRIHTLSEIDSVGSPEVVAGLPTLETVTIEGIGATSESALLEALSRNPSLASVSFGRSTGLSLAELHARARILDPNYAPKVWSKQGQL